MSEWWTYRLSDFLMFTSNTYFRLFEQSNRTWWPLQLVFILAGMLTMYYVAHRTKPVVVSAAAMLFGFVWIWVGWEFHWKLYAPVMLAAPWFAGAFLLQGVAMGIGGRALSSIEQRQPIEFRLGWILLLTGLLLQPLLGLVFGRPLAQLQIFGIAPDPTVTATLGFLFFIRANWTLFVIPLLWCLVTAATLYSLEVPDTWVMLTIFVTALGGLIYRRSIR